MERLRYWPNRPRWRWLWCWRHRPMDLQDSFIRGFRVCSRCFKVILLPRWTWMYAEVWEDPRSGVKPEGRMVLTLVTGSLWDRWRWRYGR